jgi:VCBS repeat-containing protein
MTKKLLLKIMRYGLSFFLFFIFSLDLFASPIQLRASRDALFTISGNKTLYSIGNFENSEIGRIGNPSILSAVSDNLFADIQAGEHHLIALEKDGTLVSWGDAVFNQVNPSFIPQPEIEISSVVSIASGGYSVYAQTISGALWGQGRNHLGQLGQNDTIDRSSFSAISLPTGNVTDFSAGMEHLLVIIDGNLYGCGSNGYGQLGDNLPLKQLEVALLDDSRTWVKVSAGGFHSLALDDQGSVWSWGKNNEGQLGRGTLSAFEATRIEITGLPVITNLSAGVEHSLFLTKNGDQRQLWVSGSHSEGQAGDQVGLNFPTPVLLTTEDNIDSMEAGPYCSLYRLGDGKTYSCGLSGLSNATTQIWFHDSFVEIQLSNDVFSLAENGADESLEVSLSRAPSGGNTVILLVHVTDSARVTVSPSSLTFNKNNWKDVQVVTISPIDDNLALESNVDIQFDVESGMSDSAFVNLPSRTVSLNLINDDVIDWVLSANALSLFENGVSDNFMVSFNSPPMGGNIVSVDLATDPAEATLSTYSLTFTGSDWDLPQMVTVTSIDDQISGNVISEITLSVNVALSDDAFLNLASSNVGLTILDFNDLPIANDDFVTAFEKGFTPTVSFVTGNLLNNDHDPDGTFLQLSAIRLGETEGTGASGNFDMPFMGSFGNLTLSSNGIFSYVVDDSNNVVDALNSGANLTDHFNVTLVDGEGAEDTSILTVVIEGNLDSMTTQLVTIGASSHSFEMIDLDNDGLWDVMGGASTHIVYRQTPVGVFTATPDALVYPLLTDSSNNIYGIGVGDLNDDGYQDILTAGPNGSVESANMAFLNDGDGDTTNGTFLNTVGNLTDTNATTFYGQLVEPAHFNNDGDLDALWLGTSGFYIALGLYTDDNAGGGSWSSVTSYPLSGLFTFDKPIIDDLDGDGDQDLTIMVDSALADTMGIGAIHQFMNNGSGNFTETILSGVNLVSPVVIDNLNPTGATSGDFNGDGFIDIAFVNWSQTGAVDAPKIIVGLRTSANGNALTYDFVSSDWIDNNNVRGLTEADINGDSHLDIIAATSSGGRLYLGQGDGTFVYSTSFGSSNSVEEPRVGDFDNDGLLDIAFDGGSVKIYFQR